MNKLINKILCLLTILKWVIIHRPVGEKSFRYCRHCRKEQESGYDSIGYTTTWNDIDKTKKE